METANKIIEELLMQRNEERAVSCLRFFKTKPGEYGEGDKFLGVSVPLQRAISKKFYRETTINDCTVLLRNPFHEVRLTALFIMVLMYKKNKNEDFRKELVDVYLCNADYINNWDLVDSSAHYILGAYYENKDKQILYKMAEDGSLWEKRMAMIACFYYIKKGNYDDALNIAIILLLDKHDLIQKAVGWMLREIGNRNPEMEMAFLDHYYKKMPRTTLRYAVEKFSSEKRKYYMV